MFKGYQGKLFCFSPPVMLATFMIELIFAVYILWRYKMTAITRLVVSILACLGIFQAAEFMICGGMGIEAGTWSRLGYASITLLPPLGLHLVHAIAGKQKTYLVSAAYASAVAFVAYFVFATGAISGQTCYANYAVFQGGSPASEILYALYYYGWLIAGVSLAFAYAKQSRKAAPALRSLALGYLAFMLPTTTVNLIDPSTISGIPSIMCGFAVLLAFVLVIRVAPQSIVKRDESFLVRFQSRI